jgi:hypothetical protein
MLGSFNLILAIGSCGSSSVYGRGSNMHLKHSHMSFSKWKSVFSSCDDNTLLCRDVSKSDAGKEVKGFSSRFITLFLHNTLHFLSA